MTPSMNCLKGLPPPGGLAFAKVTGALMRPPTEKETTMLSAAQVVASSTIGAAVAVAAIVMERHLKDTDLESKIQQARTDGYYQGRESVMQDIAATAQHAQEYANSTR